MFLVDNSSDVSVHHPSINDSCNLVFSLFAVLTSFEQTEKHNF